MGFIWIQRIFFMAQMGWCPKHPKIIIYVPPKSWLLRKNLDKWVHLMEGLKKSTQNTKLSTHHWKVVNQLWWCHIGFINAHQQRQYTLLLQFQSPIVLFTPYGSSMACKSKSQSYDLVNSPACHFWLVFHTWESPCSFSTSHSYRNSPMNFHVFFWEWQVW